MGNEEIGVGDVVYFESFSDSGDYYQLLSRGTGIVFSKEELMTGGELYIIQYINKDGEADSAAVCVGNTSYPADTVRLLKELIGD